MKDIIAHIAEERIKEAMERGEFSNLPGKGKPLNLDDDSRIPEDLRVAYRILKNAGYLPPEIELGKEIDSFKQAILSMEEGEEKRKALKELNFKMMKLNMMRKEPLYLENLPEYRDKVIAKLTSRNKEGQGKKQ